MLSVAIEDYKAGLEKFAAMFSGNYGVRLVFKGTQAHTNGRTITVPELSLLERKNMSEQEVKEALDYLTCTRGYVYHEGAHIIFSDFNPALFKKIADIGGKKFHQLFNILEDARVENKLTSTAYPGAKEVLSFTRHFVNTETKHAFEQRAKAGQPLTQYSNLMYAIGLLGNLDGQGRKHPLWMTLSLEARRKAKQLKPLIEKARMASSSNACFKIAKQIWDELHEKKDKDEDKNEQQEEDSDQDESEQEEQSSSPKSKRSKGKKQKVKDEQEEDDKENDDEEEQDDEEEDGEGGGEDEEEQDDDEEDGDGDEGDDPDADEDDEEADEDEDSDSSSGDADDSDDEEDEDEGSSGSSGDSEDDDESDEDESDAESDDGDGASGDDDDEDDAEPDDRDDEKSGGGDSEDSSSDVEEDEEKDPNAKEEKAKAGGNGDKNDPFELDDKDNKDDIRDAADTLTEKVQQEAQKQPPGKYRVYTTEFDVIGPPPGSDEPTPAERQFVAKLDEETRSVYGPLRRNLENLLKARTQSYHVRGLDEGELDQTNLHVLAQATHHKSPQLQQQSRHIFSQKVRTLSLDDTVVGLTIDKSGSMGGPAGGSQSKDRLAMKCADILGQALDGVHVPFEVTAWSTEQTESFKNASDADRKLYTRFSGLVFHILKGYDQDWRASRFRLRHLQAYRTNLDGESIWLAASRLLARPEKRKVLFAMSDGMPSGEYYDNHRAVHQHLHETVARIRAAGIELYAIGINAPEVKEFYSPHFVNVNDARQLPTVMIDHLKSVLHLK